MRDNGELRAQSGKVSIFMWDELSFFLLEFLSRLRERISVPAVPDKTFLMTVVPVE